MVMHARKIPRLNDGCYERNQPHPFEDKYSSKSQGSGYGERYAADKSAYESATTGNGSGMARLHEASPSRPSSGRYNTGKPSYMDRSKERLEKGASTSPGDRRGNHSGGSMYGGGGTRGGDGGSGSSSGGDRHVSHGKEQHKDHRSEIQKSAIRVCGDWSEHLSSSGKKYYYNCTTEVSQWEKPKEWLEMYAREKNSRERHQNKFDERHRHSSGGGGSTNHRVSASTSATSSSSVTAVRHTSGSDQRTNTYPNYSAATEHRQSPYAARSSYEGSSSSGAASDNHRGSTASANHPTKQWTNSNRELYRNKEGSTVASLSRSHTDPYRAERYGRRDDTWSSGGSRGVQAFNGNRSMSMDHTPRHDTEDTRQAAEDMDISPGSTPPNSGHNSHSNSRTGTPSSSTPGGGASNSSYTLTTSTSKAANVLGAAVGALPRSAMPQAHSTHHHPHHQSPRIDNNDLTQQAIQTLQKLQEALVAQQLQHKKQQEQQQQQQLHQQQQQQHLHHLQQQQQQQQHHHQQQHLHPQHPHHHPAQSLHVSSGTTTAPTQTTTPLHSLPVQHHHHQLHQHPHHHAHQQPPLQHPTNPHHPAHLSHQPHHLQSNNAVNQSPARPSEVTSPNRDPLQGQGQGQGVVPGQSAHVNSADASCRNNKEDELATGQESPRSDHSVHSNSRRTASPTPSQSSSQSVNVGGSSLSAAAKRTDSILLQPSLANYYKDELITHITSWQNEANERQTREACRFSEEAHCIGTMHCMQVSVELKKARSLVRIAEIQATVQEQRVLFLKNQIKELENMKSQNSFMPYQGT